MSDISNQLIKDSYDYVLQADLLTGIVYRIGGEIPVNPKFVSGLTIYSGFTFADGSENNNYVLTSDAFGNATWKPISGATIGDSGLSGISGIEGLSGISGLVGNSGIIGNSGISGVSGLNGTSGISGISGQLGVSGLSGQSGISGIIGTSGINGTVGISGISGTEGTSGISGDSGISGRSGISGTVGQNGISTGQIYYFNQSVTQSPLTYKQLSPTPLSSTQQIVTHTLLGNSSNNLISEFITDQLGFAVIPGGTQRFHQHFLKPASNDGIEFYCQIDLSNSAGTSYTTFTANTNTALIGWVDSTTPVESLVDLVLPTSTINPTDRMIVRIYANNIDSSNHILKWYTEGTSYYSFVQTSVGVIGNSGQSGISGNSGISGTVGASGISGISGNSGLSGISGRSGISGIVGVSGISGMVGSSGLEGNSGLEGISGIFGNSGFIGNDGSNSARWKYDDTTTPPTDPGNEHFNVDNPSFPLLGKVLINRYDTYNTDFYNWLISMKYYLTLGQKVYLEIFRVTNNPIGYGIYEVTIVDEFATYFSITLTFISGDGGFGSYNDEYSFSWSVAGTLGVSGPQGESGISGTEGLRGVDGATSRTFMWDGVAGGVINPGTFVNQGSDNLQFSNDYLHFSYDFDYYGNDITTWWDIPKGWSPNNIILQIVKQSDNSKIGQYSGFSYVLVLSPTDILFKLQGSYQATNYNLVNGELYSVSWQLIGTNGNSGISGSDGLSGISGIVGTSGISGILGTSGISGTIGTSGISGTVGTSGISGNVGTSGISGTVGTSGISGILGTSGISGTIGTSGISGTVGTSGISGTVGTSGISGTIGTSGISGTGTSGISGIAGGGGTGITWSAITTSQNAVVNYGFITNSGSLITLTLPTTASVGSIIEVVGIGAGGWKVAQNAGQTIHFGIVNSQTGAGGYIQSTQTYDAVRLLCTTVDTDFTVLSAIGNITIIT